MVTYANIKATTSYKEQGFTLVELAIVLVIIGLIIGGVLVGQDLIKAAAIRQQISQIDKFNTATNTFRAKYGFLPGDIPTATTYFGAAAIGAITPYNGDGNGYITSVNGTIVGDYTDSQLPKGEVINVFADLSLAGLVAEGATSNTASVIAGQSCGINWPRSKLAQGIGIIPQYIDGYNQWLAGYDCSQTSGVAVVVGLTVNAFTPYQAQNIDLKMDDGYPLTGGVQSRTSATNTAVNNMWSAFVLAGNDGTTTANRACFNLAGSAYNVGKIVAGVAVANLDTDLPNCIMVFRWN